MFPDEPSERKTCGLSISFMSRARGLLADTPLHNAIMIHAKPKYIVKMLKSRKYDINAKNYRGYTPLHLAVKESLLYVVDVLLRHGGCDINACDFYNGESALHMAISNKTECSLQIMKMILRAGGNVHGRASDGQIPLHRAVASRDMDMVKLLVECDSNPAAPDCDGHTPMHHAIWQKNPVILHELLNGKRSFEVFSYASKNIPNILDSVYQALEDCNNSISIENLDVIIKMLMKHLARLYASGKMVHKSFYRSIIKRNVFWYYFSNYMAEISLMRYYRFTDTVSFFDLFTMDPSEFLDTFRIKMSELKLKADCPKLFPNYIDDLKMSLGEIELLKRIRSRRSILKGLMRLSSRIKNYFATNIRPETLGDYDNKRI